MAFNKLLTFLFVIVALFSCNKNDTSETQTSNKNDFKDYIANVSSGIISKKSDIRIVLIQPVAEWSNNLELNDAYFSVSPKVKGKWIALNNRTISFQPETAFKQDTEYVFKVHLNKFQKIEKDLNHFSFKVKTIKQDFIVTTNSLQSYNRDWQYLVGNIKTSDVLLLEDAKKLVSATQDGAPLTIKFDTVLDDSKFFTFTIDSIQRKADDSEIQISYNGKPIDVDQDYNFPYAIIGKNNFQVV